MATETGLLAEALEHPNETTLRVISGVMLADAVRAAGCEPLELEPELIEIERGIFFSETDKNLSSED